jgi:DMSO/TMAO reductase YedYZ molybdopterin-dependent catalytic subunit
VRWRWRPLKLGLGLWFVAMAALLPLTGAGFFASDLFDNRWAAVVGYLGIALAYAGCIGWSTTTLAAKSADAGRGTGRRAAVRLLGGAAVALAFARLGAGAKAGPPVRRLEVSAVPEIDVSVVSNVEAGALFAESTRWSATVSDVVSEPRPVPAWPEPPPPRRLKRDINGATLPAGRRPGELTDLVTSNDDFYVVSKNAAGDPVQSAEHWRLRIQGEVVEATELDYIGLRSLPSVEVTKTLECISNLAAECQLAPFGCDLISSARWTGVRLSDALNLAGGAGPRATSLMVVSADEYTTSLPLEVALDPDTLLVYQMNGQVLPREHGYPVRLLVPGRYGMKNPKWVVGLRLVAGDTPDWYGQRNWSQQGFVRTMTRIDVPAPGALLSPGEYNVAGIAYGGDRGIQQVEFSVDGGSTWEVAELLEPPAGRDVWVRWLGTFMLDADGPVSILARATDGDGTLQPEAFDLPQPDGSAGWPSVEVHPRTA